MVCSNCGYALGPDDQFCGGCGAYLTDAPQEQPATTQDEPWVVPYAPARQEPPPRRGPSAGIISGAIAALLIVGVLLVWLLNRDGDQVASDNATTPAVTQTTGAPTTESPSAPSETATGTTDPATETATETATAEPSEIELAGSAAQCSNVGSMAVYRGNSQTSCPFAENVARAFADLEQPFTEAITLSGVASPVTGQTYDLSCDFTTPVRCAGGDNAVVYLSPSS